LAGYDFAGWYTEANGGGTLVDATSVNSVTEDQTLYAKWIAHDFTVTFDSQGGSAVGTTTWTYDELFGNYPGSDPELAGYDFAGWYTEANGGGTLVDATSVNSVTEDQTLYAKWTANVYAITYNFNGGKIHVGTGYYSGTYQDTWTFNTAFTIPITSSAMVRTGYTFVGWSTVQDDGATLVDGSASFTADTILYAFWSPN